MTATAHSRDVAFTDEAVVRTELTRVFDVCQGCRKCSTLCTSFPTLFDLLDSFTEPEAGRLTPAQQDLVIDACVQCKLCTVTCPYTPDKHEWAIDFSRLMLRSNAMRYENGHLSVREKVTSTVLGRTDLVGRVASFAEPVANTLVAARPGSMLRRLLEGVTGVSSERLLRPFARERFTRWFRTRPTIKMQRKQASVSVLPTCLVEYQATGIGKDLVKVYERNGIECSMSGVGCCGAPSLHAGDMKRFTKLAKRNIKQLAAEVRAGTDIVVAQPTCSAVIRDDYVAVVGGSDAELVAEHTYDVSEYLMTLHRGDDYVLDTQFDGVTPRSITLHQSSLLRAQEVGFSGRDLMRLTGASIRVVQDASGIHGLWGLRSGNEEHVRLLAERLGASIAKAGAEIVAGECQLENGVIREQTGVEVMHPIQVLARAYGIPDEA